jgi:predicted ATPase/class 3 adenylate cyclase
MECLRCQHENPADATFCDECGTRLEAACSACGTANRAGAKFCRRCGQTLAHAIGSAQPIAPRFTSPETYTPKHLAEKILTSKAALEGERKQVTVLFADLKGSMELLADRDPEEARKILDPVLERMMEAVHRYEGTVNQVMGDGIMALFGAPLAHEDHAVRACYAALRMQESVSRYGDQLQRGGGAPVFIRVGLNSGEVVVRSVGSDLHMDYTAVGQTTHLAARMEQLAKPGSVLITGRTLRLAEGYVQVKPLGPVPVKGVSHPVEVHEVTGAGTIRLRLQASAARGLTKFVGRTAEIDQLAHALERTRRGHGQIVAMVGEPGVGKSRLYWEFTHSHRTQGWRIVEVSSVSYGKATAYLPVIELLKAYYQIETGDDARKIREKVTGKLLSLDRALEPSLPAVLALLDVPVEDAGWLRLDPRQRRQRTLDAVKRILLRESQVQPLVVVFEDLHWIDGETQTLLDSLVESLPTDRLLLLVNYRPEYQHGWGGKTYYSQLRIDPLAAESAEQLLRALLGDDPAFGPLTRLLIERTEGNPFFLEESVRSLVETGSLSGERGAYRLAHALPTIQIPATVQAVLAARIDRLPPEEKQLLQAAGVIGTEVPLPLLQAIAELSEGTLHRGLAHLQAAEFLYETRLFPERAYTFKHALTQQVAYQSLLTSTRRRYHQQLAQTLEAQFPEMVETQPELLAHHYIEAGLVAQAIPYWQRAGQRAIQRSAHLEAIGYLTRGLEVLATLPGSSERLQQELDLQTTLGQALMVVKGYAAPEVQQVYGRARELCRHVEQTPQLFQVLWGLAYFYTLRSQCRTSREVGEQLCSLAQRAQDPVLLQQAHNAMAGALLHLGELSAAQEHLQQGIALYDPQQHRSLVLRVGIDLGVFFLAYMVRPLWLLGYPDQALRQSHKALTMAQELAHPFSLTYAINFAALGHQFRREAQETQMRAEASCALAGEQGFAFFLALGTVLRGWALAEQGQRDAGIVQMCEGMAACRTTGAEADRPYFLALVAEACGRGRRYNEGLAMLEEALDLVDQYEERYWEAEIHRLNGELLLARSAENQVEAEACLHKALEVARRQGAKSLELRAAMSLSRLWQRQGKRAARQVLAEVYGWFTEGFDTPDLQEARALLDALA